MSPKIRYATAPMLSLNYPDCASCIVEVESTGDEWLCPSCETTWSYGNGDGDTGQLYADWSGEDVSDIPLRTHAAGWQFS